MSTASVCDRCKATAPRSAKGWASFIDYPDVRDLCPACHKEFRRWLAEGSGQ